MNTNSSLCPSCGVKPRRIPGGKCTACDVAANRARRARKKLEGSRQRVRIEPEDEERWSRPLNSTRYLVTCAQNATPVHAEFLEALQVAAAHLDAEIVVIPIRYKNPTSVWSSKQDSDEWWDWRLWPYLFNQRRKLNANLVLVGDVKIQPTATSPLSGFESLTGQESCIIGHPKMQLRSVPAPSGRTPKILTTTGAVTTKNYTDTKAGALGDFHHFLGATLVELDGKKFYLRQINADRLTGEFTDLDTVYSPSGVRPAPPAEGLALGDIHARLIDQNVERATFGPGGIVETLNPKTLVWHDTLDGYAVNPHHKGNPFISRAKSLAGFGNIQAEVEHTVQFVCERSVGRRSVIVASNHDNFLSRWVVDSDWRSQTGNATFYLETAQAMLKSVRMGPGGTEYADPFAYWVNKLKGDAQVKCLAANESFRLAGVECGNHGDKGPNGARGTLRNLARLGARMISGHTHTPGIEEGHYQLGTSTPLRLEYANGPSSWLNAHCVVYASGKRSLIVIIGGKWRLPPPSRSPRASK